MRVRVFASLLSTLLFSFAGIQTSVANVYVASISNMDLQIMTEFGGSSVIQVRARDQAGNPFAGAAVIPSVTGRNATRGAQPTLVTNSNGYAYFTLKDTSASSTELTDTVIFYSSSAQGFNRVTTVASAASTTITYVSSLNIGSVTVSTPNSPQESAGIALSPIDINAGSGGAEDGFVTVTAQVKDKNGSILSGVRVNWSVTGGGAAVMATTQSTYTNVSGIATAKVYGWLAGEKELKATSGGISGTAKLAFAQNTPSEVRIAKVFTEGRRIDILATDRFGNPVKDVPFTATILGDGFFGVGINIFPDARTEYNGKVTFLVLQSVKPVDIRVEFGSSPGLITAFGQSGALAGSFLTSGASPALYVAGTTEVDEANVGNEIQYLPKGGFDRSMPITLSPDEAFVNAQKEIMESVSKALLSSKSALQAANAASDRAEAATLASESAVVSAEAATESTKKAARKISASVLDLNINILKIQKSVTKVTKKIKSR